MAATDARAWFTGLNNMGSVEIDELGIVKRKLRVLSIMVDLHGLEIRSCDLAVRTLKLRMAAFLRS